MLVLCLGNGLPPVLDIDNINMDPQIRCSYEQTNSVQISGIYFYNGLH